MQRRNRKNQPETVTVTSLNAYVTRDDVTSLGHFGAEALHLVPLQQAILLSTIFYEFVTGTEGHCG